MYVQLFFGYIRRSCILLSVHVQNPDFEDTAVQDSVTLLMMVIFYNMGNTIYLMDSLSLVSLGLNSYYNYIQNYAK